MTAGSSGGGDNPQAATAVWTVLNVDLKNALEQARPADARRRCWPRCVGMISTEPPVCDGWAGDVTAQLFELATLIRAATQPRM